MRKRIVIGLLALVVIAGLAFFVSQPKKGSVEWHKREYLAAWDRIEEKTWSDRVRRVYQRVMNVPEGTSRSASDKFHLAAESADQHLAALVRLGYLKTIRVDVTNREISHVSGVAVYNGRTAAEVAREFIDIAAAGPRAIAITAPAKRLPEIEAAIRKADVP